MNGPAEISLDRLAYLLGPIALVGVLYVRLKLKAHIVAYATARMLLQLIAVGFLLAFLFKTSNVWLILSLLVFMLVVSAWIAGRTIERSRHILVSMSVALLVGCIPVLILVQGAILQAETWYEPRMLIPLAGMIYSNAMTSLSLAAERYESERKSGMDIDGAVAQAFDTSMIPTLNAFFAVGLVSLPGMMTGQILSGVSPFVAVRYQIVVMGMVLSASGISSYCYLKMRAKHAQ